MRAGAPVEQKMLDKHLGSETIIFASGSDVVQSPSTTTDLKAMSLQVNEQIDNSLSNGAHRCAAKGTGATWGGLKRSIFFTPGVVNLWGQTRTEIAPGTELP